jgi:hypothetical protein
MSISSSSALAQSSLQLLPSGGPSSASALADVAGQKTAKLANPAATESLLPPSSGSNLGPNSPSI